MRSFECCPGLRTHPIPQSSDDRLLLPHCGHVHTTNQAERLENREIILFEVAKIVFALCQSSFGLARVDTVGNLNVSVPPGKGAISSTRPLSLKLKVIKHMFKEGFDSVSQPLTQASNFPRITSLVAPPVRIPLE